MEDNVTFKTVAEFKQICHAMSMQVVHNAKTGKLSVLMDGRFLRCQQNLNTNVQMAFLIPNGNIDDACLVNVGTPLTTMVEL